MSSSAAILIQSFESFTLDASRFPAVRISLHGELSLRDAEAMTQSIEREIFSRRANYTLLVDATQAGVPGADARRLFAGFSSKNSHHTQRYCRGEAYVLPSALLRGALTAIMWVSPFKHPHKVFATVPEASDWLAQVA